ncbi:hypothetical protein H0H92_008546 [Tricholoma furcatifolium]|nr:hypothetical protein H0H92_008546 [Tricholoma furcatifolium]
MTESQAIAANINYRTQNESRARRVGVISPSNAFNLNEDASYSQPPPSSPPVPVRSPLRPIARSISNTSSMTDSADTKPPRPRRPATPPALDIGDFASIVEEPLPLTFQMRHRSYPTALEDSQALDTKELPPRPESMLSIEDENTGSSSSSSSSAPLQAPMTKRHHALHELLSTERAYASDLALIREFHIPLALGQHVPLNIAPTTPPPLSSSSSSRTVSSMSDSSSGNREPPMTPEDVRIIFSNIAELAQFSDRFCDCLEEALGSTLDGGEGEDCVGALFLEIIPDLERPYKTYINRHPTALNHLQSLPQSPALTEYIQQTQAVASNLSHAWDIASLLIKPVQRLLKYSLLLNAIIEETPDSHGDKENLRLARQKMEEVARNVNEGRRRAEVVREVLNAKKRPVNVSVAASVNLTKMKSLSRHNKPADGEAAQVERLHAELKRIDTFAQQFAKNVVDWAKMMNNMMLALRTWAIGFGKVIGLSPESGSEAFEAFMAVIQEQLTRLCVRLEAEVNERLLRDIAHLLGTMNQPLKLLESMEEQEPYHYHLLNMNVSAKNRPPASLLAASTNYLALRGQLAAELPTYLVLLHRGLSRFVVRLAEIQASFWGEVRDRWAELWDMLRVEGEMNAGYAETVAVWQARWADVDEVTAMLSITQPKKLYHDPPPRYEVATAMTPVLAAAEPQYSPKPKGRTPSVVNMLTALEPVHVPSQKVVSAPQPLIPRGRPRGHSDASVAPTVMPPKRESIDKKTSNDNIPGSSISSKPQNKKHDALMEFVASLPGPATPRTKSPGREHVAVQQQPPLPRMKSMPLSGPDQPLSSHRSSTSSRYDGESSHHSQEPLLDEDRGRTTHNPGLRRKFTDSIRPTGGHYRRRSASKSAQTFMEDPDAPPPPTVYPQQQQQQQPRSQTQSNRDSWFTKPAKYMCLVVHECRPPVPVSYFSFPFFTLLEGDMYEVLHEAGHPSLHSKLPLHVDDGEDCLLLCRDGVGDVGWALASFLAPIDGPTFS